MNAALTSLCSAEVLLVAEILEVVVKTLRTRMAYAEIRFTDRGEVTRTRQPLTSAAPASLLRSPASREVYKGGTGAGQGPPAALQGVSEPVFSQNREI